MVKPFIEHSTSGVKCAVCDVYYILVDDQSHAEHEQSLLHKECAENAITISLKDKAFSSKLWTHHLKNLNSDQTELGLFLRSVKTILKVLIQNGLQEFNSMKCNIWVYADYVKAESKETRQFQFKTKNIPLYPMSDLDSKIEEAMFKKVLKESEDFTMKGSGWTISQIVGLDLKINKYCALVRPESFIEFKRTSAIVNVRNNDNLCFKYAMLGKHVGKKRMNLPSSYEKLEGKIYDFTCVDFPVAIDQIEVFEKVNKVSVNVFGFNDETQKYFPIKIVDKELPDHTDLLIIEDKKQNNAHYAWIINLPKLLNNQLTGKKNKRYLCKKCFSHFRAQKGLDDHNKLCRSPQCAKPEPDMPDKGATLKFKNHSHDITHDCVVYADFEALLEPVDSVARPSGAYQHHEPMAYAYVCNSSNPQFHTEEPVVYSGKNAHVHFVNEMISLAHRVAETYDSKRIPKIRMYKKDLIAFDEATVCALCHKEFTEENPKVKDHTHEHVPGNKSNYRAALHKSCNLSYYHPRSIIIFFHNLAKYDMHFIVKALNGCPHTVNIIPSSAETYLSLSLQIKDEIKIKFVDSFRFLSSSLSELVSSVPERNLRRTRRLCKNRKQTNLITKKGIYPYDYVTDRSMLSIPSPPPQSAFYSKFHQKQISPEDYQRFLETWSAFNIENLGDYTKLYLKMDVCQLSDVFEEFRCVAKEQYKLDPVHYLSLPGFSLDAFLKQSKVEIELLSDRKMLDMIMSGVRGGICQNVLPHCKANNKYLSDHDPKERSTYIQYLDATALYANSMCKPLPISDYKWVSLKADTFNVLEVSNDAEVGYILDVNLSYPKELHDLHSDLPFCCENKIPPNPDSKHVKLLTTLEPKTNYVIHYVALKQALKHGLVLEKINRAISFKQMPFMKEYMLQNAKLRKEAAQNGNKFYQDLYKLMNNSCYGKLLENPLKWQTIKLATNSRQIMKHVSAHNFIDREIFDDELVAVHLQQLSVKFEKPIIAGFSVLELSKVHMYSFFYEELMAKYGRENMNLCYMDTDSFILFLKTDDLYADMLSNLNKYDTSNFPKGHQCHSQNNCKQMGTFKDETGGAHILEYCGLRSKAYALITEEDLIKRANGVQSVVRDCLRFEDYKNSLFKNEAVVMTNRFFQSSRHEIFTSKVDKVALSSFDDKRQKLSQTLSLPYGHYKLDQDVLSGKRQAETSEISETSESENKRMKMVSVSKQNLNSNFEG